MKTAEQVLVKDLRDTDIFAGLSDSNLEQIARCCSQHIYQEGDFCARQDDMVDHLLIIKAGQVAIEMRVEVPPYAHTVTIAIRTRGKVCAWSALVPPQTLTASVRCTKRTEMISIAASDLERIFAEDPPIEGTVMKNLAGIISSRLRESRTHLLRLIAELIKQGK